MEDFGAYIRTVREEKLQTDRSFSLRQVAQRIGIEPAYLSKIERGDFAPPSEEVIRKLAGELNENPDVLLAMAGKVSKELLSVIMKRPKLIGDLIRQIDEMPDQAILKIVREVKDGEW
jgi:transcriptional regulator with XRE-family HTH domain